MLDAPSYLVILYYVSIFAAAITTTAFPIIYATFPWWRSFVGRALMTRSIAFAILVDATIIFHFWNIQNLAFALIVNVLLWGFLAYGAGSTIFALLRKNESEEIVMSYKERTNV